jgi:hypothetical protein
MTETGSPTSLNPEVSARTLTSPLAYAFPACSHVYEYSEVGAHGSAVSLLPEHGFPMDPPLRRTKEIPHARQKGASE